MRYEKSEDTYTETRDEPRARGGNRRERSIFEGDGSRGDWGRDRSEQRGSEGKRYDERGSRGWSGRGRDDRDYSDDSRRGLPLDETSHLIASNKVNGTAVYGRDDNRLGSIYNFMVDKYSGRVEYAVMSFGGVLGMGSRYYPLPWQVLTYDVDRGGYRIPMTERDLRNAPSFDRETEPRFDRRYGSRVYDYYGLNY